ncbi:MAG: hypothetical protein WA154_11095 [Moraxellaceae bacterium]
MTTPKNTLPALADLAPAASLLQATEATLTEVVTGFFDIADQQAAAIIAKYDGVVWQHLETGKGMQAAVDARAELRTFRTGIVDKGHAAIKSPLLAIGRIADGRKQALGDRLKASEKVVDDQIKAEEQRKAAEKERLAKIERERVAAIRENIHGISMMPSTLVGKTAAQMREILGEMTNPVDCPDEFQELAEEAAIAYANATDAIGRLIADADAREAEQARLKVEREKLAEEQRLAAEERQRQQEAAAKVQAELDAQAAEIRRQREEWELEQERARIAEQAAREKATLSDIDKAGVSTEEFAAGATAMATACAEMGSDLADLISSRPADVQTLTNPVPRPSVEELVMIVAEAKMVSEDVAYGWLVGAFGSKSEAA